MMKSRRSRTGEGGVRLPLTCASFSSPTLGEERGARAPYQVRGGRHRTAGARGFTLIEVLVALTILSISLATLLAVFTQGLDRARESRNEASARVLAQSLLAQAKTSTNLAVGDSGGRTNDLYWHLRVAPYGSSADLAAWQATPTEISAKVTWLGSSGGRRSVTLSTLRYVPKPSTGSQSDSDSDSE